MFQNKNNSDLESNILFEGINSEILQSFSNPKNTIGKKEGSVIFQKGDLSEYLYLLIEGTVKLKMTEPDGTNVYINKSGNSFFGETELLGKTQRKSSAVADSDCRIYTFNLNELKVLIKKDKQILKNIFNNKTFDVSDIDFIESTKGLLSTDTDISELTKTTEKITVKESNTEEQAPVIEPKITSENEKGTFDNIITKEEIDEDIDKSEINLEDDNSIVIDDVKDEEEQKISDTEDNDSIITENTNEIKSPEVDVSPSINKPESEPVDENKEEEIIPALVTQKEVEADFSDYYETLLDVTRNIFSKVSIEETAEAISESSMKLVNATGGVLYLVDKGNEELKAKVLSDSSIKDIRIKFSDGLQGAAILEKRTIISEDPHNDKNFNPVIEDLTGVRFKTVIYYPILTKSEEAVAVLELFNSERGKFDSREIELLNAISPSIIKALDNARFVDILVQQRKIISLGEIIAFIDEDIKNTLRKVRYYSSLLKKKNLSPEVNKLLEIQIGQINSIEDFLKFTDAYAHGKSVVELSTIKVSEAITQVLNFLAEYVESRNTVIYKKIEYDAVINVDLPAMYLICYQIAKNACDSMNDDGKIYVTTEKDGNYVKIKFKDTGIGISETIKGKLFKPFVTQGKKQKAGLGLAIAEKLVSNQGGYMVAESVLGEGATITVALPVVF